MIRLKSLRAGLKELLSLNDTPDRIAKGATWGIFISITPTFGLHALIALGISIIFRLNKLATVVGSWFNNHLTAIPIYYMCYKVGTFITGKNVDFSIKPLSFSRYLHLGLDILVPLWIGSIIIGILISFPMFFIIRYVLKKYKEKKYDTIKR
ncbi:MAG: DUF2062 domain-containing protein [Deltaproteobacteria bacterium]|nr:DUF2062 domain-containing protein [Deltaproteobacteria bacterium]